MQKGLLKLGARGLGAVAAAAMIAGAFAVPAKAADFSGEQIEWIIPFGVGGGSDVWARVYAPHLGPALPGSPTVVVRNEPGGGSITGTNMFAERAEPDGLTILGTSGSTQFPYLLGNPNVQYEYRDWNVVLVTPVGGVAYINPELGVKEPADLNKIKDHKMVYVAQAATSLDLVPLLAFELLDLNVEAIFGADGRAPGRLAFERGETDIDYQTTPAYLANVEPLVEQGKAQPLMSWGALDDDGNLVRDPTFPDLPHFGEVYEAVHGEEPSGPAWEAWKAFFSAGFAAQKMVFLPEGTPQDIIDAYTEAFTEVVNDPDFKEEAKDSLGAYTQATGNAAKAQFEVAIDVDPEAKEWVLNWLKERFQVEIN